MKLLEDSKRHIASAEESYLGHLRFAWRGSLLLFSSAAALWLHGLVPAIHSNTASRRVKILHRRLSRRNGRT
jgi:hypothetical protein